jgi:homoserine dehydrogenase
MRVAVLGAGTVGREVVRALLERPEELRPSDGAALELTAIAVRDVARALSGGLPPALVGDAPAHLVADDDVDVVVELMGGDEPAHTLIAAALSMGKSVVTANSTSSPTTAPNWRHRPAEGGPPPRPRCGHPGLGTSDRPRRTGRRVRTVNGVLHPGPADEANR